MSARKIVVLTLVLAALVAIAIWQRQPAPPPAAGGLSAGNLFFPDLDVNRVGRLEIVSGAATTTLSRAEDTWTVTSLYDYPVHFQRLAGALRGLRELEVGQVIPDGERYLDEFGLSTTAQATAVHLYDDEGDSMERFYLGSNWVRQTGPGGLGASPQGRYLRVQDGPVTLVDETLDAFTANHLDWVNRTLLRVPLAQINELEVTLTNVSYTLHVDSANRYTLEESREEEELDSTAASRLARSLANVTFIEVLDPALAEGIDFSDAEQLVAKTANGIVYTARVAHHADRPNDCYARFRVAYEPPQPPTRADAEARVPPRGATPPETEADEPNTEEAPRDREAEVDAELKRLQEEYDAQVEASWEEAQELNQRLSPWTYVIPNYTCESMTLSRAALIQQPDPPAPAGENQPTP